MTRKAGSPPLKSSRSSRKRQPKKSAAPPPLEIPESFLDFPDWITDPSDAAEIPEYVTELVANQAAWLQSQKQRKRELCGEKERKRTRGRPPPLDELLAHFPLKANEATPAPTKKSPAPARKEIKDEVVTPVAVPTPLPPKPLPQAVTLLKNAHESQRPKHRGTPSAPSTAPATPRRPVKTEKDLVPKQVHPIEDKCLKAVERKKLAAQEKADKIKKENEEKKRKVDAKRREQEAVVEKKRLDLLKKQEHAAEVRRLNASPARSRIASAVNTPARAGASRTPSAVARTKVRLFAATAASPVRTPGRAPAKAAKIEKPDGAGPVNTNFGSAPREPKRKPVLRTTAASLAEEFADLPPKHSKRTSSVVVKKERQDSFANAQMRFLMEHDSVEEDQKRESEEAARLRREQQEEEERLRAEAEQERLRAEAEEERLRAEAEEEERQRKEERRRRKKEEEERRRKEEEERLERERQEMEKRREEEEERIKEEKRRLQEEEVRRMEERWAEAVKEQGWDDDYEDEISQRLNESILEDAPEATTENNISVYDMTQDKIFQPSTAENYNIGDLSSGDETDDESDPRKNVPSWADWPSLTKIGADQAKIKCDYVDMYGTMENPYTQPIFKATKKTRRQRGSSAQWNSPSSNPTKGYSRFLAQQEQ